MPHEWIDPGLTTVFERCAAESERAACEAIAREMSKEYLQLAEPMKRPTTRAYFEKAANALDHAADAIAARKPT
jgi:hypothetical protein